jgi:cytochrome c2
MRGAAAAAFVVLALAASGCGSGVGRTVSGNADTSNGKQLFVERCGFCHTLAEAKTSGKVGPNLDESFQPDYEQGFDDSTIRQVVADQIKFAGNFGEHGPTMPKNLVKGEDVDDVAAYVAAVAGPRKGVAITAAPGGGGGEAGGTTTTGTTPAGGGGGGGGTADVAAGKDAFNSNGCGACHTLSAAGTNGKVGPDLDKLKAYAADAKKPVEDFTHESIVAPNDYVEEGFPKGVMPDFSHLPKNTIDALVAFLVQSAKG